MLSQQEQKTCSVQQDRDVFSLATLDLSTKGKHLGYKLDFVMIR